MAVPRAKPAEIIDISPLHTALKSAQTTTLIKTDSLEVIRLVLLAGNEIKRHQVPGEITVQCLEGHVVFCTEDSECELTAGKLIYLASSVDHSLRGSADSSLLITIMLKHKKL